MKPQYEKAFYRTAGAIRTAGWSLATLFEIEQSFTYQHVGLGLVSLPLAYLAIESAADTIKGTYHDWTFKAIAPIRDKIEERIKRKHQKT